MPTTIINASAGSGKTYQLALAYLQALLQPLPDGGRVLPQQVLATTFTRAAASEILERVLRRLAEAVLSRDELERLLADLGRPELQRADLVALLESVCQVMPQLQIGTIDGLFSRIIRVMGLDLAFPHAWNVADDTEAEELALAAADRMLRGEDVRESRAQWRRYAQFKPGIRVRAALMDLLEEPRFLLLDAPVLPDDPELAEPQKLALSEANQLAEALAAFDLPRTKAGTPNAIWRNAVARIQASLPGEPTLISLLKEHALVRVADREGNRFSQVLVSAELRAILGPLGDRARADLRRLHEARLPALAMLARRYHHLRREVAYARAAYTFREIEASVWTRPSHLSAEDLYFRLDGRIQHLLLDEFQDTSLSQFRFLWPIITEVCANDRRFFAVGDIKQSIYGWRGADRRLLDRLPGWLCDPDLSQRSLPENWRSCPAVLRAIDRVFEHLDQAACLDPALYKDSDRQSRVQARRNAAASFIANYQPHVPKGKNRFLVGRVRLVLTERTDLDLDLDEEESPDEIESIVQIVEQHRREDAEREIAILCRRRKFMPTILARLLARGIAASGEGGNPVADSLAVETVLSMLTWLDHPGHSLAREQVLLSGVAEVFGLDGSPHDAALPGRCALAIMRRGLAAVLAEWVRHEKFRRFCTVHDQIRVEQLVELARHWDAAGGGRLSDFVGQVRSRRVDNPASSKVRVMTIHGAKGLEFDAVILADLEAEGRADEPRLVLAMADPEQPPTVTLLPSADEAGLLGLEEPYQRHQQELFEEQLSVLYVALTRAKSFLDVVLSTDDKLKPTLPAILRERWGAHEAGMHLIDACTAQTDALAPPARTVIESDPGIARADENPPKIADWQTVPGRRETVTPSGREGAGIVNLGVLLQTANASALQRGTAVHALLSRLEWIEDLPAEDEWIRAIPRHEADPEACRTAARELYPRLRRSGDGLAKVFDSRLWLARWKAAGVSRLEVWRERRFAVIVGEDLMNGSFDRVVLGYDAAGKRLRAEILDFKTDRIAGDLEREERRLYYQPQLDAYVEALRLLTALPPESIEAHLVWINGPAPAHGALL